MKKIYWLISIFLLLLLVFRLSCYWGDRSKSKYSLTAEVCNKKLFIEMFTIWGGGALGGDRVSDYLTDSINFRMYIGTFDSGHEFYSYQCNGDSINIYKVKKGIEGSVNKIISTRVYSLSDLKKKKIFE